MEATPSPYCQALLSAWEMGRADGITAATWDLESEAVPLASGAARGRSPAAFARHLWGDRPGQPPAGLEVNGPLWYATGYREALHDALAGEPRPASSTTRDTA